ncbi:ArsR/SmtB family transcription factor [Nocardia sp. CDC160]|uniref:ArsR/SmtB family transcription factor n=1 Tax=Nocardia sp. CDC160 TaxID=3112166 RepID=UPI002DB70FE8|nr:winged helix-turn-helix domain-containing protein [Nocardia sp. CDC160]MEC3920588.1 winged helix-turn-helix domain-containing protein [Nocardia sp. CDC160]
MEPIRDGDVDISGAARLLADPARARMLTVLADGRAQPAGELARAAGVTAATASEHLGKMVDQGWLAVERVGRHRYYRIALPEVVQAIEAMALISPVRPVKSLRGARANRDLKIARSCYDHLAGAVGVAVFDALCDASMLNIIDGQWSAADRSHPLLDELGVAAADLRQFGRRPPVRVCLDWSERRYHLAGGLGALLLRRMREERWCAPGNTPRAVTITPAGRDALQRTIGLDTATLRVA